MKKYLTSNDLKKIEHKKGIILAQKGSINLVQRDSNEITINSKVFTVWNFEENFIFINTQDINEAKIVYKKYTGETI